MDDNRKAEEKLSGKKPQGAHQYNIGGMARKEINPEEQPQPKTGGADKGGANKKESR